MGKGRRKMIGAAVGAALVATFALGPSVASADPIGDASALTVTVTVAGVSVTLGPTPAVSTPPGGSDTRINQAVPAAGTSVSVLTASSQPSGANVTSLAQVVGANVLSGTLTADVISSTCTATPSGATGSSALANAQAAGVPINVSPPPNQTLTLPGVGMLILNEQVRSGSSSITVNAVRLALTGALIGGGILISHSACSADATTVAGGTAGPAGAVPGNPDFLAG
jgi:hypothetical protein